MTIDELLKLSGIPYKQDDASRIGVQVLKLAKEAKLKIRRKKQMSGNYKFSVNDYPESFLPVMQDKVIEYFTSKPIKEALV